MIHSIKSQTGEAELFILHHGDIHGKFTLKELSEIPECNLTLTGVKSRIKSDRIKEKYNDLWDLITRPLLHSIPASKQTKNNYRKKTANETSYCVCDKCWLKDSCENECKTFNRYVNSVSVEHREQIYNDFVARQDLSIKLRKVDV